MITLLLATALANPTLNDPERSYQLELDAEVGFLAPVSHTIQFGSDGDKLNYIADGGQDNLFPFVRPTLRLHWRKQMFTVLWQPLDIRTTVVLEDDFQVDGRVFPADRPIDLRYGFSFWRGSWGHKVIDKENTTLALGLGLQIRNATISFTSVDGSLSETNRDIGPVPLLELEWRQEAGNGFFFETEADGFYAPIKYLNGGDVDVVGAIADIQVRGGLHLQPPIDAFLGLRYIGGGASGTGDADGTGDGYTENWLHFLTLSVGFRLR